MPAAKAATSRRLLKTFAYLPLRRFLPVSRKSMSVVSLGMSEWRALIVPRSSSQWERPAVITDWCASSPGFLNASGCGFTTRFPDSSK